MFFINYCPLRFALPGALVIGLKNKDCDGPVEEICQDDWVRRRWCLGGWSTDQFVVFYTL